MNSLKKSSNSLLGQVSINTNPNKVEFDVFWREDIVAGVTVNFSNQEVWVKQYTDNKLIKPFVKDDSDLTVTDVLDFLESRCFPKSRANVDEVLNLLGLTYYRPLDIVRKTHGVQWDDFMWIRFKGEDLTFEDVKVRD